MPRALQLVPAQNGCILYRPWLAGRVTPRLFGRIYGQNLASAQETKHELTKKNEKKAGSAMFGDDSD
jgi:hypothetical protein